MRRLSFLVSCLLFSVLFARAQDSTAYQSLSAALLVPFGNFSETHFGGIGLQYTWAGKKAAAGRVRKKVFRFTANGGVSAYLGREEKIVSASYTYPIFLFVHSYAGIGWRPLNRINIDLTAGPALGIYNGTVEFNLGAKLESSYNISRNFSAGPSLQLIKEKGSDPLWAGSLFLQYHF